MSASVSDRQSNTRDAKTVAILASTMRAGSTLLKALLAEAEDVSSLPEVNFQKFQAPAARAEIEALDPSRIVVLKRPAWFHETRRYPRLPAVEGVRRIVLVRDAYETIRSLKKMAFRQASPWVGPLVNRWLKNYWCNVTERIVALNEGGAGDGNGLTSLLRYEELVARPLETTARLFEFLGSSQSAGVDEYRAPENYQWTWGQDDGGPRIRELRVLPPVQHDYEDRGLLKTICDCPRALRLRQRLGYADLPR